MDRRPFTNQDQATSPKDTDQGAMIQALHKQERERTIAQRDQQINRIEQDTHDRRRAMRSSTIVAP